MSMMTHDFLVEIGTEELPPKALKKLLASFSEGIQQGLTASELSFGTVSTFASPRRMAVRIENLQAVQVDKTVEKKGPAKKAAFDAEGNPSRAAQGFARGCGIDVSELSEMDTPKGVWMVYYQEEKGQAVSVLLNDIVNESLAKLPIPKRMRWGSSDIEFVRPVHWAIMLLDSEVVPGCILGNETGNITRGHRFHAPQNIVIDSPASYVSTLKNDGFVLVDMDERKALIRQQVEACAKSAGGIADIDEDLLDEVTALNEWPSAVMGDFDEAFLSVPSEALISAMKGHQKYFHALDANGKLMPKFITISNIESTRPASVKEGNERVIRPRLADAKFFWDKDNQVGLEHFLPRLEKVVFQKDLGTVFDKVLRLEALTTQVGNSLGVTPEIASRAARLSKCDLMSEMVGEFPDLQGVMGRYYATNQHEHADVCAAIDEQYQPRFAGDNLPEKAVSQALAIADKLDTITGIFGVGLVPTGDKDPFALRRAALGLMRIMIEKSLNLDLRELISASLELHKGVEKTDKLVANIENFIISRLKSYYASKGISAEQFDAVRVCRPSQPFDFHKRLDAVAQFSKLDQADSLSAANKRIANILKKVEGRVANEVNEGLFENDAETALWNTLSDVSRSVSALIVKREYTQAMTVLADLSQPVDAFFDQVMVMADDEAVKQNRLALLQKIYQLFLNIADISRL